MRDEPEAHSIDIARCSEDEFERPEQREYVELGMSCIELGGVAYWQTAVDDPWAAWNACVGA